jgi:predicted ABC-type transport system involved in lysophospholipase L1 biosynthesis ATPase subunit
MSAPLLEVRGLVKDYQSLRPLRVRALSVEPGAVLTLAGFDAPAAEMFVHLVTGAALPDEGDVVLFGTNTRGIADANAWLRSLDELGLISHRAVMIDALSVLQNVTMPLTLDVDPIDPAFRPAAEALAREAGIPEAAWSQPLGRADAEVNVRVRLARALAPRPRLLIAEHPSAALPREAVRRVAKDVHAVAAARGAALLTLTADASWAAEAGGDVLSLRPGTGELAVAAGFVERFRRMWGGR